MPYPNLKNSTAPQRLARARNEAARVSAMPHNMASNTVYTWRNMRERFNLAYYGIPGNWPAEWKPARHESLADKPYHFAELDQMPARYVGTAQDVMNNNSGYRRLGHAGWCCDDNQDRIAIGHVYKLPARNGKPYYFPAVEIKGTNCHTARPLDHYESKEEAARAADGYAERLAEKEREYYEQDQREQAIEAAKEAIVEARRSALALLKQARPWRRNGMMKDAPDVCAALRETVRRRCEEIRKARLLINNGGVQ